MNNMSKSIEESSSDIFNKDYWCCDRNPQLFSFKDSMEQSEYYLRHDVDWLDKNAPQYAKLVLNHNDKREYIEDQIRHLETAMEYLTSLRTRKIKKTTKKLAKEIKNDRKKSRKRKRYPSDDFYIEEPVSKKRRSSSPYQSLDDPGYEDDHPPYQQLSSPQYQPSSPQIQF